TPSGDALVVAAFTDDPGVLAWWHVDASGGEARSVGRFVPSQEQAILFNFFDQYADSHPPVSPDGRYLLYAGLDAPAGASAPRAAPMIYTIDLAGLAKPEAVAEGAIAAWRPGRG
ncbi:MAG: hypothetical protein KC466_14250, partial [Myxococcales bacterium]|nr:hypothetical protein [Myxococcales bacterium]